MSKVINMADFQVRGKFADKLNEMYETAKASNSKLTKAKWLEEYFEQCEQKRVTNGDNDLTQEIEFFRTVSDTKKGEKLIVSKEEKLSQIREKLGLPDSDSPIRITREHLYSVAAEIAGKTIAELSLEGMDYLAQKYITSSLETATAQGTRGVLGSADDKIEKAFIDAVYQGLKADKQQIPISDISRIGGLNYNSVKGWRDRNGYVFAMPISKAKKLAEKFEAEYNYQSPWKN